MLIYITVLYFLIPTIHLTYIRTVLREVWIWMWKVKHWRFQEQHNVLTLSHKQDLQKPLPYLSAFRCMIVYHILSFNKGQCPSRKQLFGVGEMPRWWRVYCSAEGLSVHPHQMAHNLIPAPRESWHLWAPCAVVLTCTSPTQTHIIEEERGRKEEMW